MKKVTAIMNKTGLVVLLIGAVATAPLVGKSRARSKAQSIRQLKHQNEVLRLKAEAQKHNLSVELLKLQIERDRLLTEKARFERDLAEVNSALERHQKAQLLRNQVEKEITYRTNPVENGAIYISDRRIGLNGAINVENAAEVIQKINYFNNKSIEHPIFLVIDYSPGGSVMEGYKIMQAIDASRAPVYVVVKSYAASMAAIIAADAKHSYAYPNAILLHHQISTQFAGNYRQQKEHMQVAKEWMNRILKPVALKMGMTLPEFTRAMYKESANGNWRLFADQAVQLKWISGTVDRMIEESYREPAAVGNNGALVAPRLPAKTAAQKKLRPFDFYYMYDPSRSIYNTLTISGEKQK